MQAEVPPYKPKNKIRIVTAASLFDGHDAAINIMRRIMQASGAEVIHLGHDRSAQEVVNCAIQEDANAIAMTSYQGGHNEYLKYMFDLLKEQGCGHIKIFAGGGGVILPSEITDLHNYGITRIYSPDDGRKMGLQGMINDILEKCDTVPPSSHIDLYIKNLKNKEARPNGSSGRAKSIASLISIVENYPDKAAEVHSKIKKLSQGKNVPVLGITGVGGAGKSSLIDEIIRRFLIDFAEKGTPLTPQVGMGVGKSIAILCVDPSKRKTGGALLGDRIRMNSIANPRVYLRSLATRQSHLALSQSISKAVEILKASGFDLILLETSGIGQSDTEIVDYSDVSLYVMTPEYGAATQLEKIDMLDYADVIAINKFDKRGAPDALRDVKKQYKRNHNVFTKKEEELPVFGTIASQFNDPGMNSLYKSVMDTIVEKTGADLHSTYKHSEEQSQKIFIIPPDRVRYLSETTETIRSYDKWADDQSEIAEKLYALHKVEGMIEDAALKKLTQKRGKELEEKLTLENRKLLEGWESEMKRYIDEFYLYNVRGKDIKVKTHSESLSHTQVPKIAVPKYKAWGEILHWCLQENFPGKFPYTAGVYPFKRSEEDPTRMFAGEGGPERTNKRFHYVSAGMPAKRLSTAFDSVTLYGRDPDYRPDIYGKIGNAGVSICCLDDAKKLYSGFNLCDPKTSVSMTINGPASIIAAFFMNAAIDQQCELYIKENRLEKEVEKKIKISIKNRA